MAVMTFIGLVVDQVVVMFAVAVVVTKSAHVRKALTCMSEQE